MSTASTQLYLLGTLWEVEIDFDYHTDGITEEFDFDDVWLIGYYPEGTGKSNDYVSCRSKADLQCMSNADYAQCEAAVREYMALAAREAFEHDHSYED